MLKATITEVKHRRATNNTALHEVYQFIFESLLKMTVTAEYTVEQRAAMEELKKRVGSEMKLELYEDTHLFYRFLKARDFNLDHAEIMLRKHLQWRKDFSLDTILNDYTPPEGLVKHFPGGLIGVDKNRCPVKYFAFGNLDPIGIRKAAKFSDIVKHIIQTTEREMIFLKKQSTEVGKELPGSVYICDFKDMPFSVATDKKALEHSIYLSKMYQDNYPERLKAVYIINISPYFALFFNIIKTFLAAAIIKKIHFCSRDDFKNKLISVIDADELPAFLGGNKTDPDGNPMCVTFVNHAGKVPSKYFINKRTIPFSKVDGVQKLIVPRSSFSEIKLERLNTEEFTETGCFKCEKIGTYVLLFDNSYSWMRSKELYYRVLVSNSKGLGEVPLD
ncbi:SEC14-like protein 3 [Nephila pilipes]|uniref:SEC14-like protein 3 n=1 Tax=Nephila pilipes TaxID=299642 RepID=A0A8X6JCF0_NEPPI|nr:SEC14-like protein 3 [Nephila pilipes]